MRVSNQGSVRERRRRTIDRWLLIAGLGGGVLVPAAVIASLHLGFFPSPTVVWAASLGVAAAFLMAVLLQIEDWWLARKGEDVPR